MRAFSAYNPIAVFVYFLTVAGTAMFCLHPVLVVLSFLGAAALFAVRNGGKQWKSHLYFLALFVIMACVNPLVSHRGVTVLFVLNDNPVTQEAVLYGLFAAGMILAVIYWFRSFSQIMTSDRLLYLFGAVSPKFALLVSMALRYVPLFGRQARRVRQAQRAAGLSGTDNIVDSARGGLRVFSILVTWGLENGIITADSMAARGYGIGRRTRFARFRFRRSDAMLLLLSLLLGGVVCAGIGTGGLDFSFYPAVKAATPTPLTYAGLGAYGLLAFLPTLLEVKERIKWNCLLSKT